MNDVGEQKSDSGGTDSDSLASGLGKRKSVAASGDNSSQPMRGDTKVTNPMMLSTE